MPFFPTDSTSQSSASFLCTICWQTQYPPCTPRVLGSHARIVCARCWKAVLDLSICWACGEVIVRGEEIVSLGWCFWHRNCFGCLLCGTRLKLDAGDVQSMGVELTSVPMCDWCRVETEGQGKDQVEQKCVEYVSNFDGGLSRSRKKKLAEEANTTMDEPKGAFRGLIKPSGGTEEHIRHGERRAKSRPNHLVRNLLVRDPVSLCSVTSVYTKNVRILQAVRIRYGNHLKVGSRKLEEMAMSRGSTLRKQMTSWRIQLTSKYTSQ